MTELLVESLIGMDTGKALVRISDDNGFELITPVEDARTIALSILHSCNAAEYDHRLFRWLTEVTGTPVDQAAIMLQELRKFDPNKPQDLPT